MDKDIFFSVIMPTYNSSSTLAKAVQSILQQSFKNFEILIIDGLSTDNTVDAAKGFNDARINIYSAKDDGIYDAMNKGISLAKGDWLYFLGSDDSLNDNEVLKKIADTADKFCKVIYGNVTIKGNTSWAKDGDKYDGKFDLKKLLKKNICHQCIFYNTSFIREEVGLYNLKYKICADWDFNMRCWKNADFVYVDEIIAKFNAGGQSTKNNIDTVFNEDMLANILSLFKISVFDAAINNKGFSHYTELRELQKKENYFKYLLNSISN